jgi:hypothetical protein
MDLRPASPVILLALACGAPAEPLVVRPAPAPSVFAWDHLPDGPRWTEHTRAAIDELAPDLPALVPDDVATWCPRYAELDLPARRTFWIALLAVLARHESAHDPDTDYKEDFTDSSGRPVVSRGLLQLSRESANGYGCNIADSRELHDPATNLRCGVRILARWIDRDHVISAHVDGRWRGAARYWSPFRRPAARDAIARETAALPDCRSQ